VLIQTLESRRLLSASPAGAVVEVTPSADPPLADTVDHGLERRRAAVSGGILNGKVISKPVPVYPPTAVNVPPAAPSPVPIPYPNLA
jgi:hypothetical protein